MLWLPCQKPQSFDGFLSTEWPWVSGATSGEALSGTDGSEGGRASRCEEGCSRGVAYSDPPGFPISVSLRDWYLEDPLECFSCVGSDSRRCLGFGQGGMVGAGMLAVLSRATFFVMMVSCGCAGCRPINTCKPIVATGCKVDRNRVIFMHSVQTMQHVSTWRAFRVV